MRRWISFRQSALLLPQGQGYYITDLSTGESWKWMDAQLSDSRAVQFNGQHIVEINISPNAKPENPQLRVYDGEIWHEVVCPEGLRTDDITGFYILALSTEYIFIQVSYPDSGSGGDVYCISYADGSYAVQHCGSFE